MISTGLGRVTDPAWKYRNFLTCSEEDMFLRPVRTDARNLGHQGTRPPAAENRSKSTASPRLGRARQRRDIDQKARGEITVPDLGNGARNCSRSAGPGSRTRAAWAGSRNKNLKRTASEYRNHPFYRHRLLLYAGSPTPVLNTYSNAKSGWAVSPALGIPGTGQRPMNALREQTQIRPDREPVKRFQSLIPTARRVTRKFLGNIYQTPISKGTHGPFMKQCVSHLRCHKQT